MGNSKEQSDIPALLKDRSERYGRTWILAGIIVAMLLEEQPRITCSPYIHNWVLIISKVVRTMYTPYDSDHWRDIAGYAQLVLEDLANAESK